jgi:hypothetical protein
MKAQKQTFNLDFNKLPKNVRSAIHRTIDVLTRYDLPCDLIIGDLPPKKTARHGWRKDGTCTIILAWDLIRRGNETAVYRRIIHEAAHCRAGRGHGHDEHFKRICSAMYEREGFSRGKPGDHCGNM